MENVVRRLIYVVCANFMSFMQVIFYCPFYCDINNALRIIL